MVRAQRRHVSALQNVRLAAVGRGAVTAPRLPTPETEMRRAPSTWRGGPLRADDLSSGRHSAAMGKYDRLDPVPDSELGEDPGDVCLDSGLGEE